MAIPNSEVSYIYRNTIRTWFDKKRKTFDMSSLFTALDEGDTEQTGEEISGFPEESISYFDYGERYYHGFLTGLMQRSRKYRVRSNRETGLGRADLILRTQRIRTGRAIILEPKVAKKIQDMEAGCQEALRQIEEKKYREELEREGYTDILEYGICFYRKSLWYFNSFPVNQQGAARCDKFGKTECKPYPCCSCKSAEQKCCRYDNDYIAQQ